MHQTDNGGKGNKRDKMRKGRGIKQKNQQEQSTKHMNIIYIGGLLRI